MKTYNVFMRVPVTHLVALGIEKQPVLIFLLVYKEKHALFLTRWWTRRGGKRVALSLSMEILYQLDKKLADAETSCIKMIRLYENNKLVFKSQALVIEDKSFSLLELHWETSGKARGLDRYAKITPVSAKYEKDWEPF